MVDVGDDMGSVSDGHHTFDELYEQRGLYHALAVRLWILSAIDVVKSWRHHDGDLVFGGGWFIVVADLPDAGQVSQHYPASMWDVFACREVAIPPVWDGHTPTDGADRIRAYLSSGNIRTY